jgi:hypothetical protein
VKKSTWFEHLTPFLFAIFPILSLALENIEFIKFSAVLRSLFYSIFVALILYIFLTLILKDYRKSGILAGLLVLILLTYGNIYLFLEERIGEPFDHRYLLGILAVLYILVGSFMIFGVKNAKDLNMAIFFGGLAMVLYLLISIGNYEYKVYRSGVLSEGSSDLITSSLADENTTSLPNIYLILLDGHTRSDVLRDNYGYDNSEFGNQLEELGFWVAKCSHSNYPATQLSLAALFEMDYPHHVYQDYDNLVFPPLNNTAVFQILSNYNYSTVTFNNFVFEHFNIKDDIRFTKEDNLFGSINEFEKELVDTSILRVLVDMEGVFPDSWVRPFEDNFYLTHYRDTLYALETLPKLPEMGERLFVFAHLLVTHDPFVFMPDGSFSTSKDFTAADYINSVEFIDTALPGIVEEIIRKSEQPPIIIVMGDHGPTVKGTPIEDRMKNLFAIYLQGAEPEAEAFYNEISPVNVFRLIFNYMFNTNFELLDEKSYEIWNPSDLGNLSHRVFPSCDP